MNTDSKPWLEIYQFWIDALLAHLPVSQLAEGWDAPIGGQLAAGEAGLPVVLLGGDGQGIAAGSLTHTTHLPVSIHC